MSYAFFSCCFYFGTVGLGINFKRQGLGVDQTDMYQWYAVMRRAAQS